MSGTKFFGKATGTTVSGIKAARLRTVSIPLAPVNEQRRVVTRLKESLTGANDVEKATVSALRLTHIIEQSILTNAFRGKLVPQDPNDEPASVLLEKIRAQRTKMVRPKNRSMHYHGR